MAARETRLSEDLPGGRSFGDLTPLLAPRSVAVIGASDREGNLGGLAVGFLQKFGYRGAVWPVNAGRDVVGGLRCFPSLAALPAVPDLAIIAVPAESVVAVVRDCLAARRAGGRRLGRRLRGDRRRGPRAAAGAGGRLPRHEPQALRAELHRHHQHRRSA